MATQSLPICDTERETVVLTATNRLPNPQDANTHEVLEFVSPQSEPRGKKRSLNEIDDTGIVPSVVSPPWRTIPLVSETSEELRSLRKEGSVLFSEYTGESVHKKRRVEDVEGLVSKPVIVDSLSGQPVDTTLSSSERERARTEPPMTSLKRPPASFTSSFRLSTTVPAEASDGDGQVDNSIGSSSGSNDPSSQASTVQPPVLFNQFSSDSTLSSGVVLLHPPLSQTKSTPSCEHTSRTSHVFYYQSQSTYPAAYLVPTLYDHPDPLSQKSCFSNSIATATTTVLNQSSTSESTNPRILSGVSPFTSIPLDQLIPPLHHHPDPLCQKSDFSYSGPTNSTIVPLRISTPSISTEMSPSSATTPQEQQLPASHHHPDPTSPSSSLSASITNNSTLLSDQTSNLESNPRVSPSPAMTPLGEQISNSHSDSTQVSHRITSGISAPSLLEHSSPKSYIPIANSDHNVQVLHETSDKVIAESPSSSPKSTCPKRRQVTSDPDSSGQVPADSPTTDAVIRTPLSPQLDHMSSEPQIPSQVIGRGADLIIELVEEDLKHIRAKHDLELTTIESIHKEDLEALKKEHAGQIASLMDTKEKEVNMLELTHRKATDEKQLVVDSFEQSTKTIEHTIKLLREKLEGAESKLSEARKKIEEKIEELKKKHEQQKKDDEKKIAKLRRERLAEKRRLEGCVEEERKMRTIEAEARRTLEQEKISSGQEVAKLKEAKLKHEVVKQNLEVWVQQMQIALEKQVEDHQKMMQTANVVWEERVKAALEIGMQKGETKGFELGKREMMDRVKELTEALVEAEKASVKEKETRILEKGRMEEEKKTMEKQQLEESKRVEELSQKAIKNLDQYWTKEIETRWARLVATEERKWGDERVRREAEDATKNAEIENRDRELAVMEKKLKVLQEQLEDRKKADTDDVLDAVELGPYTRTEAKSMLEELARRKAGSTTLGSRVDERPDDPCYVQ